MLALIIVIIIINEKWKDNCDNKATHVKSQDGSSRVMVIQGHGWATVFVESVYLTSQHKHRLCACEWCW